MKQKWNTVRIVLAAVLGSLFWAGCASAPHRPAFVESTRDLQANGPDTFPQDRPGYYNSNFENYDVQAIE